MVGPWQAIVDRYSAKSRSRRTGTCWSCCPHAALGSTWHSGGHGAHSLDHKIWATEGHVSMASTTKPGSWVLSTTRSQRVVTGEATIFFAGQVQVRYERRCSRREEGAIYGSAFMFVIASGKRKERWFQQSWLVQIVCSPMALSLSSVFILGASP